MMHCIQSLLKSWNALCEEQTENIRLCWSSQISHLLRHEWHWKHLLLNKNICFCAPQRKVGQLYDNTRASKCFLNSCFKSWSAVESCGFTQNEWFCSDPSVSLAVLRRLALCTLNWTRFRCCANSWKKPWWGPARRRWCCSRPHWSRPTMEVGHSRGANSEWTASSSLKCSCSSWAWRHITSQKIVCVCVCFIHLSRRCLCVLMFCVLSVSFMNLSSRNVFVSFELHSHIFWDQTHQIKCRSRLFFDVCVTACTACQSSRSLAFWL